MKLCDGPNVDLSDFSKEFIVKIDVSITKLDVVLIQRGRPITCKNHALSTKRQLKSVYEG